MTLVSSIIRRAYRRSQIIAKVSDPDTAEETEALDALNGIIPGVLGFEVGSELSDLMIGGENDQSSLVSDGVPDDARLVLNLAAATTIYLDPRPYEGQRVAIADAGYTLDTYTLTLNGNGRRIEAAATVALSTEGLSRQWMYRGDTANWVKITDLGTGDQMPFPQEFDDFFITRLAMILNPMYGAALAAETVQAMALAEAQIQARYRKPRPAQDTGTYGFLGQRTGYLSDELL